MAYDVKVVPTSVVSEVYDSCRSGRFYSSKADISGVCVKLVTASKSDLDMWVDNFRSMSDSVRSHAMVICLQDDSRGLEVDYDPVTSIAVLYNFDYYGWIKSIARQRCGHNRTVQDRQDHSVMGPSAHPQRIPGDG